METMTLATITPSLQQLQQAPVAAATHAILQAAPITELVQAAMAIQQTMGTVMKEGEHYGTIPGCGDRKTLFKSGAEKLCSLFRIACDFVVEDLTDDEAVHYRVTCRMMSILGGAYLGSGLGECTSREDKYAWRAIVVQEEFDATPPDDRREKFVRIKGDARDKKTGKPFTEKQVRQNPYNLGNTILKMAKKRAMVDAVLTVTAASDIFTQDLEDLETTAASQVVHGAQVAAAAALSEADEVAVADILAMATSLELTDDDFLAAANCKKGDLRRLTSPAISDLHKRLTAFYNQTQNG